MKAILKLKSYCHKKYVKKTIIQRLKNKISRSLKARAFLWLKESVISTKLFVQKLSIVDTSVLRRERYLCFKSIKNHNNTVQLNMVSSKVNSTTKLVALLTNLRKKSLKQNLEVIRYKTKLQSNKFEVLNSIMHKTYIKLTKQSFQKWCETSTLDKFWKRAEKCSTASSKLCEYNQDLHNLVQLSEMNDNGGLSDITNSYLSKSISKESSKLQSKYLRASHLTQSMGVSMWVTR